MSLADIPDIAAMKLDCISARGAKRDFVDLFYICRAGYSLDKLFKFYDKKYSKLSSNLVPIHKSLVFFEDADIEEMPRMLKQTSWEEIKLFFNREVKAWVNRQ